MNRIIEVLTLAWQCSLLIASVLMTFAGIALTVSSLLAGDGQSAVICLGYTGMASCGVFLVWDSFR